MRCAPLTIGLGILLASLAGYSAEAAPPPILEIHGQVILPDNRPAAKARLSFGIGGAPRVEVEADKDGQFTLAGRFLQNETVVARSADGSFQAEFIVAALEALTLAAKPLRVELRPARRITVKVNSDGRPVQGAQVAVAYRPLSPEMTDERGEATLLVPDRIGSLDISAWHPQLGAAGGEIALAAGDRSEESLALSLHQPHPARIRVVDDAGKPVVGIGLFPSFKPVGGEWFSGSCFSLLRSITDAAGEVEVAWAPMLIQYYDVELVEGDWVLESIDQAEADGPAVAHVRQKRPFQGKVVVPAGRDPKGLLIAGHSFGPGNRIDGVATRALADGTFLLKLAPEHCYVLAVCDAKWASEPITGVFARSDSNESVPLPELKLYPATPLEIRATIGPQHMPLRDTFVQLSRPIDSEWRDAAGKGRTGAHVIRHWVKTDADGYVRTGVGRGQHELSISHEKWHQKQMLAVDSDRPLSVGLHKPYESRREITGQLAQKANEPSGYADVKVVALEQGRRAATKVDVTVDAEGRFVFSTDCPQVTFFALDTAASACGTVVAAETDSQVTIKLQPAASYEGQLVDAQGAPMANASLMLNIESAPTIFASQAKTDASGQFRFAHVFANVPVRLSLATSGRPQPLAEHFFEPGEQRTGVRIRSAATNRRNEEVRRPLRERIEVAARDARLANMHVLAIIGGDGEQAQQFVQNSVLDFQENPMVYEFLTVSLTAAEARAHADDRDYARHAKWPMPAEKQLTLAAIDGQGKTLGHTLVAADSPDAGKQASEFLAKYKPVVPAGEELWQAAFTQARQSDRRVLVQFGGPRCGPCFLFSRWIEDHHQQIARDYVVLKLHSGRHSGALEIEERLRGKSGSIPWTAILDRDGKVLATSDGPLGNIGFPGDFESIRHFRRMLEKTARRLSAEDIAALVATLGK